MHACRGREEDQVRLMVEDLKLSGKQVYTGRTQGVQATDKERGSTMASYLRQNRKGEDQANQAGV